ncbi:SPFH domain-containing protein [Methylobacillus sp.]|uniref:SPFH domain-containing protein n=1 Tax=Methylobacillus sp. TaxID=56818 RepID=UPI0012C0BCDC|nr:SPFH domain-containing protein [Methylobacillus sp.]MPS48514.1 hypothetical protein [Methylobacillus sp.]
MSSMLTACGFIETGEVGVRTTMGETSPNEETQGFYQSVVGSVDVYTIKQFAIDLEDLKPKAGDNLSLRELDATFYLRVDPAQVADLAIKYKGQSWRSGSGEAWIPGYNLLRRQATAALEKEVAKIDSLEIHKKRDVIEKATHARLQSVLDAEDPGMFIVENVTIGKALTDESIEESIRKVVQAQKDDEAMTIKQSIATKQAALNASLNQTYTPSYLQHEYNEALKECAKNSNCTLVVGNPAGQILNLK